VHDTAKQWNALDPLTMRVAQEGLYIGEFAQVTAGDTPTRSVDCTPAGSGASAVFGIVPAP